MFVHVHKEKTGRTIHKGGDDKHIILFIWPDIELKKTSTLVDENGCGD